MSNSSLKKGLKLKDATKLKSIVIENSNLYRLSVASNTDLNTFKNLETLIVGSSNPFCDTINLRYGYEPTSNTDWEETTIGGSYNEYGYSAYNLKSLDVSKCPNLKNLFLPLASQQFADTEKKYLSLININNTRLGREGNLDNFFFSGPEFNPDNYPEGHVLEVFANNVRDLANGPCILSMSDYLRLLTRWDEQGKSLIIYTDSIS